MALLETLQLEHLPSTHGIHIALYRNLKNASFLHQQLLAGNTDFEYALIDASIIVSRVHALAAAFRAVNDLLSGRLKSRNVHSEIVFSLSSNNNIAESFRRFGITPSTTSLLVIKVAPAASSDSIRAHLSSSMDGEALHFTNEELAGITDLARIRKAYKLSSAGRGGERGGAKNAAIVNGNAKVDETRELEILVLGAMALRGATN